jgi:LPXTG-site transpeptidase (sortase) family protein
MKLLPRFLILFGLMCIVCCFLVIILTFYPAAREEIRYNTHQINPVQQPIDTQFGIVIPKIGANARIIPNVDPYDSKIYQQALTRGVAHAKGTALPNENGSMFLFSHSSVDFFVASAYNSIFYLLNKLEVNDEIDIYYSDIQYTYHVSEKKIVEASDVSYLTSTVLTKQLILMTCWPPGTSFKRLLVIGALSSE